MALPQQTTDMSAADLISARQASLDMSSITLRFMNDAMKAGRDTKSQSYPASVLAKWAKTLPHMFPRGTGKGETPINSQALLEIWRDRAGFAQTAENYANATARLIALAAANDTPAFTKQLGEVNEACGSCHARYKEGAQGPPQK
jgi:cytochrome c556